MWGYFEKSTGFSSSSSEASCRRRPLCLILKYLGWFLMSIALVEKVVVSSTWSISCSPGRCLKQVWLKLYPLDLNYYESNTTVMSSYRKLITPEFSTFWVQWAAVNTNLSGNISLNIRFYFNSLAVDKRAPTSAILLALRGIKKEEGSPWELILIGFFFP